MGREQPANDEHRVRFLAGVLFLTGFPWASIAWVAVLGGAFAAVENVGKAFLRHDPSRLANALFLLLFSAQAACGYAIWGSGWGEIAVGRRRSSRRFWAWAATHQVIWLALFVAVSWGATRGRNPYVWYSSFVFLACVVAALAEPGNAQARKDLRRDEWPELA